MRPSKDPGCQGPSPPRLKAVEVKFQGNAAAKRRYVAGDGFNACSKRIFERAAETGVEGASHTHLRLSLEINYSPKDPGCRRCKILEAPSL